MPDQRAEYLAERRKQLAKLLIGQCQSLINRIAFCKHQPKVEHLDLLVEAVNDSRDTILEFGGALTANQPLEVCGVKGAGIAPVVWHLANRLLLLVKSVLNCKGEIGAKVLRGKEELVRAYAGRFYGDVDIDWLEAELSIEAAQFTVANSVNDYDRCRWKGSELDDFLAVRDALPESWVHMNYEARRRWVEGRPARSDGTASDHQAIPAKYRSGGVRDGEPLTAEFINDFTQGEIGFSNANLGRYVSDRTKPKGSRAYVYGWDALCRHGKNRHVDVEARYAKWQSSQCKVCD